MKLEVLASGSKGNCYLLHTSCGIIILEAGVPWDTVLRALKFNITNVLCCLITHEHMDHAKYALEYQKNGILLDMTEGTRTKICTNKTIALKNKIIGKNGIVISKFDTQHDAIEPCGYYIEDTNTRESLVFATDTYYVKYLFPNVNYIMVECNYAEDILKENIENGIINGSRIRRLRESHFELNNVKKFIIANDSKNLKDVILLHLSDQNSDVERFKREMQRVTLARINIAKKGLKVDLGGV